MRADRVRSDPPWRTTAAEHDIADLCGLLQIERRQFERDQDRYFAALSVLLCFHEITVPGETVDAATFRAAVRAFQRAAGLEPDGIPGEKTLWELNYSWVMAHRVGLVSVELDNIGGARGTPTEAGRRQVAVQVRADMAAALSAWRSELLAAGVPLVCDTRHRRTMVAEDAFGQPGTAAHFAGLAVDLDPMAGMTSRGPFDAEDQPYAVTTDGTGWRVWARSPVGAEVRLSAVGWTRGALRVRRVDGRFLDLTAIAARHGLTGVAPGPSFPDHYEDAAWWHFQYQAGLVPWLSQFGCEVLRLKTNSETALRANHLLWAERHRIFCCSRHGWGTRWPPDDGRESCRRG